MENLQTILDNLSPAKGSREVLNWLGPVVRAHVMHIPRNEPISTKELAELIFPIAMARGEGVIARNRMFQLLMYAAARDLADCCVRGEERWLRNKPGGRKIRPWQWSTPGQRNQDGRDLDRRKAEAKYMSAFRDTMRKSVRRLGYDETKRIVAEAMAHYDDPVFATAVDESAI